MVDIIFTKHSLQRLNERLFNRRMVNETIENPDKVIPGKENGTLEYQKKQGKQTVTAIVRKGTHGQNLVLSCWVDPPVYGTQDYRKKKRYAKYQKASFWGKLWMDLLSIFGI